MKYGGISFTTSFLLRMLLMLIASIPLLANGIWRNFLLLSWRGSDWTGLKRRKDATSHIILDNLYLGEQTRFDFVWMQTQKSPNDPHIIIRACWCKFHHYQPIPYFKILLDIYFHWNRRPLTIWRLCWQPFWKWWPRKNDPECKFHHYQPIPHFKILIDIDFHWYRRPLSICRICWRPFWKRWHRKNDPRCNFHHYQSIPHFKITLNINFHWNQRTLKFCRFCRRPFWK